MGLLGAGRSGRNPREESAGGDPQILCMSIQDQGNGRWERHLLTRGPEDEADASDAAKRRIKAPRQTSFVPRNTSPCSPAPQCLVLARSCQAGHDTRRTETPEMSGS